MRRVLLVLLVLASVLSVGVGPAVSSPDDVKVRIRRNATISEDGLHMLVRLRVRCPAEPPLLEAFVYINQDGNESQFGGLNPTCDGSWHRSTARVDAFEEAPFHPGRAVATAFVLLCDEAGTECVSGEGSRRIRLREA
jgi:hypothetical protein